MTLTLPGERSAARPRRNDHDGSLWGPWMYATALTWWAASWSLHHTPLMSWIPINPVYVGVALVVASVIHRLGQTMRLPVVGVVCLCGVVVGCLPGAVAGSSGGYGPEKVAVLAFITLPMVVAAFLLFSTERARRAWVWAQGLAGVAVTVAATELRGPASLVRAERLTLAGMDTIATGRFVGVLVLLLILVAMARPARFWWLLLPALAAGVVLIRVGSRGPFLFALLSLMVVVATTRHFARRRLILLSSLAAGAVAVYAYAAQAGGAGAERIIGAVQNGFADDTRSILLEQAISLGLAHPFGVGWGEFAQWSSEGRLRADSQQNYYPHNLFAEAFAEGGWAALIVVTVVVAVAVHRCWRVASTPVGAATLATLVYWLLNAQVSSDFVGNRFMWLAIACGLAVSLPSGERAEPMPNARRQE